MLATKFLSIFIIHQDLSFGGFALKIELVAFVHELYLFMILGYVIKFRKKAIYLYTV